MNACLKQMGWIIFVMAMLAPASSAIGAERPPAVGDAYVYRLLNGYNKGIRGQLRYEVARVEAGDVTVRVVPDNPGAGLPRTEIVTREGNFLRRVLDSHDAWMEYEFATPYPAYVLPLEPGKSWSVRVNAVVPGLAKPRSVRVDGKVLGRERIRVPAGEFDTVKIRRAIYPGDGGQGLEETQISEMEWYAPALGRVVRIEKRSVWLDRNRCIEERDCNFHGDWDVLELVEMPARDR